jgi:tetratricopeptide (TPR) repeat protein
MVYRLMGNHPQALEYYQEALGYRHRLGDVYAEARYIEVGYLMTNLCRFQEAWTFLENCLAIARKTGMRNNEGHTLLAMGGWHLYQGNVGTAIETYQKSLEILKTLRNANLTNSAKSSLGFAHYHLGNLEQSRRWLEDSLAQSQAIGHKISVALASIQLGLVEIAGGNLEAARSRIITGLELARAVQSTEMTAASLAAYSQLERLAGSPETASKLAEEGLDGLSRLGLTGLEMWVRVEAGLAAADCGELEAALEHTRTAIALIPQAHQMWISSERVVLAHARVLRLAGDETGAAELERRLQGMSGLATSLMN